MIGQPNWRSLLVMHRCVAGTCTEPNLANGSADHAQTSGSCQYPYCAVNASIQLRCNLGYHYLGQPHITCVKDDTWFPSPGRCEPIDYCE